MKEPKDLQMVFSYLAALIFGIYLIAFFTLMGCESNPVTPTIQPIPVLEQAYKPLSWDTAERLEWSKYLLMKIDSHKDTLDTAKDIKDFCPRYSSLNDFGQKQAWGEFFIALAHYESSWNPKSSSVDVGKPGDKDTYSIGLYQVSVVDQSWAGGNLKYTYAELLTAKPNIHLAMNLFVRQIKKYGKILIPKGEKGIYWAVLHPGGRYDKTKEIIARVKKNAPECYK